MPDSFMKLGTHYVVSRMTKKKKLTTQLRRKKNPYTNKKSIR